MSKTKVTLQEGTSLIGKCMRDFFAPSDLCLNTTRIFPQRLLYVQYNGYRDNTYLGLICIVIIFSVTAGVWIEYNVSTSLG